jgi:capsid protein
MVSKPSILQRAINAVWGASHPGTQGPADGITSVDNLQPWSYAGQTQFAPWENSLYDGGKFAGGFGPTQVQMVDYWTLRARSAQLFNENHYARGIIRRLITNVINTGLMPEACPEEEILGLAEDSLADWTEETETRFGLWSKSPQVCDFQKESTFGAVQRAAYSEALVCGDVLVVLRQNPKTKLPQVQLVSGSSVQSPLGSNASIRRGHTIKHGVEFDAAGRSTAYWVRQETGETKRIPAYGEKSGRRIAWLVFATDKRLDDVRGQPLLSIVLQSLKEIDRYRDSTQRKAVVNSFMAMFIKKNSDKPGTLPMTGGAVRKDSVPVSDSTTDGTPRKFNITQHVPGMIAEELQEGEEPIMKGGEGTDVNFGTFEEAIVSSIAWSLELPPEILKLSFSNNYSASQAAINEVKMAIHLKWGDWGETFCHPIYVEWLISENLRGKISAPGLLEAWRDPLKHDMLAAWVSADWYGAIKPSTDMLKQGKGSKLLVEQGWSTNAREARITTGTKFSKNMKRLRRENEQKAQAARPLLELQAEFGQQGANQALAAVSDAVVEAVADGMEESRDGAYN